MGIKLKLKKAEVLTVLTVSPSSKIRKVAKSNRKRSRKSKPKNVSDSDDSSYEKKPKRERVNNSKATTVEKEPEQQTPWGLLIPEQILLKIFENVVNQEGCLPSLVRLGKVCSIWNQISLTPRLWHSLNFSAWTKQKWRTELKLKWLIENRMEACTDLNIAYWKVTNINCVLSILAECCPNLVGLSLAGWKGFTSKHLTFIVEQFQSLQRLDLSWINIEMIYKSTVSLQSLCHAIQTMGERLIHLYLAHNKLAGVPQIVTALSSSYRIYHTKAIYETLSDKVALNVSINENGDLSIYIYLPEDVQHPYFAVNLVLDSNNDDEYDFEVVKRTVNSCKLFNDSSYEPVVQFLYKMYLQNGNFPKKCPITKGLYYFKNMKFDPKQFPQLMVEKNAFLSVKIISKINRKFKPLAFYKVFFAVERVQEAKATEQGNRTSASKSDQVKIPSRPTRPKE